MGQFWKVTRLVFLFFIYINWWLFLFVFIILPWLHILFWRRIHIKNKIQRRLIRSGVPKTLAKKSARKYKNLLDEYGSIKGLFQITKQVRSVSDSKSSSKRKATEDESLPTSTSSSYSYSL